MGLWVVCPTLWVFISGCVTILYPDLSIPPDVNILQLWDQLFLRTAQQPLDKFLGQRRLREEEEHVQVCRGTLLGNQRTRTNTNQVADGFLGLVLFNFHLSSKPLELPAAFLPSPSTPARTWKRHKLHTTARLWWGSTILAELSPLGLARR